MLTDTDLCLHIYQHTHSQEMFPATKQSFKVLLVVTEQFWLSKWLNPFMSTHTHKHMSSHSQTHNHWLEPLGPDITVLATGTNRALPASNPWSSCSILCVCVCWEKKKKEEGVLCGWILQIIAWWAWVMVVCSPIDYYTFSWESRSWDWGQEREKKKKLQKALRRVTLYFSRHNVYKTPGAHMHTHIHPDTTIHTYQICDWKPQSDINPRQKHKLPYGNEWTLHLWIE